MTDVRDILSTITQVHKALTDKGWYAYGYNMFTIDSDGVLTAELMGSGYDVEGRLEKLVAKAKGAQPARGN